MMAVNKVVRWPKIYLFGDSITQYCFSGEGCWGALVADHFQRRADVVARGFSGYNTRQCLALLPYVAADLKDVVGATVFLGANDASEPVNTQQFVPLQEYVQNLKDIVAHFQKAGIDPVVITPPALDGKAWHENCKERDRLYTKDEELTAMYAQACSHTAIELKVPCIDLHTAMMVEENWQGLLSDGLHLSCRGSELLASLLVPVLEKHVNNLPSELLLPLWDELDAKNPSDSFVEWCKKNGGKFS
ncbi:isoamyl acetate-hydrolyzing esterase 1 homolog [Homarus americanus]|uniref:isoamyl acetate-hydrolyzing esterase 1 homolog n=1 Tax=Homarus americanus TaxID=6706 RepID=UPI001C470C0F|nr:isoamyl acetate-hydrolyzing esterase 1 homolog [Homarus americanus]